MKLLENIAQLPQRLVNWWQQTFNRFGVIGKFIFGCGTILFACCSCSLLLFIMLPNPQANREESTQATVEPSRAANTVQPEEVDAVAAATDAPTATRTAVPAETRPPTATTAATMASTATAVPTVPPSPTAGATTTPSPSRPPTDTATAAPTATPPPTIAPSPTATPEPTIGGLAWDDGRLAQAMARLELELVTMLYNPRNQSFLILYRNPLQDADVCAAPFEIEHRAVLFLVTSLLRDGYPAVDQVFIEQVNSQEDLLSRLTWNADRDVIMVEGPEVFLERCRT